MEDNILRHAENCLNAFQAKQAIKMMKEFIPTIVNMNKAIYDEMLKQGFNEQQAFKFSSEFTLKSIFKENCEEGDA